MTFDLMAFMGVVRHGSINKAAEALHISQPALSRKIHLLEQRWGVDFFERTAKGMILTEYGRLFHRKAELALRAMQDAEVEIGFMKKQRAPVISISVGMLWNHVFLPGILQRFKSRYPGVAIHTHAVEDSGRLEGVLRGRYDLALGRLPPEKEAEDHSIITEQLVSSGHSIFAYKNHPLFQSRRKKDVPRYPWIKLSSENESIGNHLGDISHKPPIFSTDIFFTAVLGMQNQNYLMTLSTKLKPILSGFDIFEVFQNDNIKPAVMGIFYMKYILRKPYIRELISIIRKQVQ